MPEAALQPAADTPYSQGGLPLPLQRHERAVAKPRPVVVSPEAKVKALRAECSALVWMAVRQKAPRQRDKSELLGLGEVNIGKFWDHCKSRMI